MELEAQTHACWVPNSEAVASMTRMRPGSLRMLQCLVATMTLEIWRKLTKSHETRGPSRYEMLAPRRPTALLSG
jgi:hypothetical protein